MWLLFIGALSLIGIEVAFAQAQGFWRNFQKLVIFDKVDTLLQAKLRKWRQLYCTVGRFGAHVGQVLSLTDVNFDVFLAVINTDDHPGVHFRARPDQELAARLGCL